MTLKVIGNRILIKPDPIEQEVDIGAKQKLIVVQSDPKAARAAQHIGTVVQVGEACWFDFPENFRGWCKRGDRVIYARHAGKFIIDPDTDEDYVMVNDNDVQCLISKEKGKK